MVRRRAFGGVKTRAAYSQPAELFKYHFDILAAQHVEPMEKPHSFKAKMYQYRNKALKAPTPESWEEFKQLPEELKQTLGGEDFCPFVCDVETEEAGAEEMLIFASANAKERLMKSPNWLLGEDLKTFNIFKKVRI